MTRLTEQNSDRPYGYAALTFSEPSVLRKLGQYEDIEELCEKILKQPVYFIELGEIIEKRYDEYDYCISYNFRGRCIEVRKFSFLKQIYDIDDYGKLWSFDKKDLER